MKILLCAYTGLGNFILKTPLIKEIKNQYPTCQLHVLFGAPWGAEKVLANSEYIDKIHWLDSKVNWSKVQHFKNIRRENYDVIFFPFDSSPTYLSIFSRFLMSDKIIIHFGYSHLKSVRFKELILKISFIFSQKRLIKVPILPGRHEIDLNFDLLLALTKKPIELTYKTFITWKEADLAHYNLPSNYVVLQVSARNGELTPKIWNLSNFLDLAKRFNLKQKKLYFVLVGDNGDRVAIDERLVKNEAPSNLINLLGETNFDELCSIINGANAIISHDSGVMHIANAMDKPLIALYGPTDYKRTSPLSTKSLVLHSRNECWARMYAFQETESDLAKKFPYGYCMKDISIEKVESELLKIIG